MRRPIYQVDVGGKDVSSRLSPILISIRVQVQNGGIATLHLELDDTNGQIEIPPIGTAITASLGYSDSGLVQVFTGKINDITSAGSREQGRVLVIVGQGVDTAGGGKTTQEMHADDTTFGDFAQKVMQGAGLTAVVSQSLAQIHRSYWAIMNESAFEWGTRIAKEIGATFTMQDGKASFTPRNGDDSASGQQLAGFHAKWGDNLIAWQVSPMVSRPAFGQFMTRWYDLVQAKWNMEKAGIAGLAVTSFATLVDRFKAADQQNAQGQSGSNGDDAARQSGQADSVTIDGEPLAQLQASCEISGVRPGVDGTYTVSEVMHELSRHGGFITELGLVNAQAKAE